MVVRLVASPDAGSVAAQRLTNRSRKRQRDRGTANPPTALGVGLVGRKTVPSPPLGLWDCRETVPHPQRSLSPGIHRLPLGLAFLSASLCTIRRATSRQSRRRTAVLLTDPLTMRKSRRNSHLCCAAGHINWQQDGSKPLSWIIHPQADLE